MGSRFASRFRTATLPPVLYLLGKPRQTGRGKRRLIDLCQARLVLSEGADSFFPSLAEKVQALRDLESSDPLTPALAAATVKRYLAEDKYRIRLNDFVGHAVREGPTQRRDGYRDR